MTRPAASTTPVRNPIEERCPSPMPRTLITNRRLPAAVPVWSGWATMLGLHSAAPSMAYSLVNVAPSNNIRASDRSSVGIQAIGEFAGMPAEGADQIAVPPVEAGDDIVQRRAHLVLVEGQDARQHQLPRGSPGARNPSWPGTKSRVMTLDGSAASRCGLRVTSPARTEVIAAQSRSAEHAAKSRSPPESTPRPGCGSPRRRAGRRIRRRSPGPT